MSRRPLFKVIDPFLLVLAGLSLLGIGVLIGVLIESDGNSGSPTLEADEIGNVKDGRTRSSPRAVRCATASRVRAAPTPPASTS